MFPLCAPTPSGVCTVTLDRPPANAIGAVARLGIVHAAVPAELRAARTAALAGELAARPREALRSARRCLVLAASPAGHAAGIEETHRLHGCDETRARAFLARRK